MSAGIEVKEFKHIPGVNDAEYIKKLEELREIDKGIINTAVAKIKKLSAQLSEQPEIKKDGDTISRQAAIDALGERPHLWTGCDYELGCANQYDLDKLAIETVPSAQPERKRGRWIVHYECPKCGEITKDFTEYCPFCNADMRGEEAEL